MASSSGNGSTNLNPYGVASVALLAASIAVHCFIRRFTGADAIGAAFVIPCVGLCLSQAAAALVFALAGLIYQSQQSETVAIEKVSSVIGCGSAIMLAHWISRMGG